MAVQALADLTALYLYDDAMPARSTGGKSPSGGGPVARAGNGHALSGTAALAYPLRGDRSLVQQLLGGATAKVRGHQDDRVAKIGFTPFNVAHKAAVKYLIKRIHHFSVRFFPLHCEAPRCKNAGTPPRSDCLPDRNRRGPAGNLTAG